MSEMPDLEAPKMPAPRRLAVMVVGRPAPQGSKHTGAHGQMREASNYLPAWRAAVKRAVYERYKVMGVTPGDLPWLRGPVRIDIKFYLDTAQRVDAPPDLDKLLRATWDALTRARVWEDDGRVVHSVASKQHGVLGWYGADIEVREWPEGGDLVARWLADYPGPARVALRDLLSE